MFSLKLVVAVTLSVGGAEGWFMEQDKGRELDGSLRCYQCDTNSKLPEDKSSAALCRSTHLIILPIQTKADSYTNLTPCSLYKQHNH